jgi:TetR/AcrR family transcriptional regulator
VSSSRTSAELQILEAARKVFHRRGMDGARMQEIAEEAGLSQALLHYYFRSKEKLFEAVFEEDFRAMLALPQLAREQSADLFDHIRRFTRAQISFLQEHPYLPRFIYQEMHRCPLPGHLTLGSQVASGVHDHLDGMIRSAVKAGQIDPIEPAQLIANIMALCIHPFLAKPMICMAYGMDEEAFQRFVEKRKRGVADFVIRALRPDASDSQRAPRRRSSPKKQ